MNTPEKNDDVLGGELRDAFEATAAAYRPDPLPTDLWDRAHRRSRTDRLQVVAACVLLVALAVGTFAWSHSAPVQPADRSESGALPTQIHVPDITTIHDVVRADGDLTTRLDLGPLSVASVLVSGHVLAVGAHDGAHHLRVLPDLAAPAGTDGTPVALSPDGTRLAWAYRGGEIPLDETTAGVRVVNLASGDVTTHAVTGTDGQRIAVQNVAWSPRGSYVAFAGVEEDDEGQVWVGAVRTDAGTWATARVPGTAWRSAIAVDDEGSVHFFSRRRHHVLRTTDDGLVNVGSVAGVGKDWSIQGAALAPDGTRVAVGGASMSEDRSRTVELPLDTDAPTPESRAWDLPVGDELFPWVRVVGWTPDGSLVGHTAMGGAVPEPQIATLSESGATTTLTTVDAKDDLVFTVATDLADSEPVTFPAPDWNRDRALATPVLVGLGLGVLVAGWLLWTLVRGRSTGVSLPTALRAARPYAVPVALAAGLVATLAPLWPPAVSSPSVPDGALPAEAHRPPEHMKPVAIGQGTPARLSVVTTEDGWSLTGVAAEDGDHVRVHAPMDHNHRRLWDEAVALSPDGRWVAAVYAAEAAHTADTVAGLQVVDLATGSSDVVELRGAHGRPVLVEEIVWSADGSHVAWSGNEAVRWDTGQSHFRGAARMVGVVAVDRSAEVTWQIERASAESAVTVSDDGVVHLLVGRRLVSFDVRTPQAAATERFVAPSPLSWSGARVSPDGTRLVTGLDGGQSIGSSATGLRFLDLTRTDSSVEVLAWPTAPAVPSGHTAALGWTPQGGLVVASQPAHHSGPTPDVTVSVLDGLDATPRVVTTVTNTNLSAVSVATDLADGPPADFGEPRWPLSTERKVLAWAFGLALALNLGTLFLLIRRRGSYRWT